MVDKCGICLSDCGEKVIRGRIDSCDHKFCFVCIMEWSKLESRCPLCKQRFQSIYRGIVPGVFSKQRTVIVPLRNQVVALVLFVLFLTLLLDHLFLFIFN